MAEPSHQEAIAQKLESVNLSAKADGSTLPPTSGPAPSVTVPGASTAQPEAGGSSSGAAPAGQANAQKVTPWDVEGGFVDGKQVAIDYDKLIKEFGTKPIDKELLERFEKLTGWKPHPLLRRGSFFSHRCGQQQVESFGALR